MDDIATPTIEATSTDTKPSYPPHVWEQIRLNLDEAFHCVETANHWAKNQSDLQRIMHELNALRNNQPIKKHHPKLTNPNQEILAKMAKMEEKQEEFQNKWNPVLAKINTATITTTITTPTTTTPTTTAKSPPNKKTWAQTAASNSPEDFAYTMVKKKSSPKTAPKPPLKTPTWKEKRVIITPNHSEMHVNSMDIRDKINTAFKNANIPITVATVNKTKNQKLAISTIDKNNADELMLHKDIWIPLIGNYSQITKDEPWHKLIVHGINTKYNDMSLIKNDIETFNSDFNLFTNPK